MKHADIEAAIPKTARMGDAATILKRNEQNVCGVTVMCKPGTSTAVRGQIAALPGVEIYETTNDDVIVVTIEDAPGHWAGETLTQVSNIPGVLNAALVYHQIEAEA